MHNIEISCLVFSTLLKVIGVFRVDLAIEYQSDAVCMLFPSFCYVFWELLLYLMYRRPFSTCTIPDLLDSVGLARIVRPHPDY